MNIRVVPVELKEANVFIEAHHRHHKKVQGHRFSAGVADEMDVLHGVATVGRPTSGLDPKAILEVTRLCTDGTPNACSMLYAATARAGKALGYLVIQTYIYEDEDGASLKASGWEFIRKAHPSGRARKRSDGKGRDTAHVAISKTLWRRALNTDDINQEFKHHKNAYEQAMFPVEASVGQGRLFSDLLREVPHNER